MLPTVVHCKRTELPFVYIARPSKWGNPFVIGKDGKRLEVIAKYEQWILHQHNLLLELPELIGHNLGCWCYPKICHGNVLLDLLLDWPHNLIRKLKNLEPSHETESLLQTLSRL